MTSKHAKALVQSITELFGDSSYADATIVCGERRRKVHQAVVCTRCETLKKAFDGHFQEGEESTITLQEDHPNAVAAMLRYLYSGDYDDRAHHDSEDDDWKALPMNAHVQDIGDKYGLPGLTALALRKFNKLIDAEDFDAPGFLPAIPAIFSNDEDHQAPYREYLMECVIENGKVLLARKDFQ
ncbi:hypothetical protein CBER1_05905 [Cercospora berteroae]|uniref:BTB domain-containing protein n=1 Tax=Cercospora berteroae TaxID=357750 RepID=A0A2S6BSB0_9PEZI|nr:hypothetical protein CBER1_05905 [Cercospora berteroae]